jgi:diguanylate cyclase (GGDEF)-like protein
VKLEDAIRELGHATNSAFTTVEVAVRALVAAARTSDLTGLHNGLALDEDFANVRSGEEKYHFLFGDLNGFKSINDSYSHEAGDAALRRTGKILGMVANNWHATAYHKSGDEFAVLVPSKHKDGLLKELKHYLALVTLPFEDRRLEFSGSFGCVDIDMLGLQQAQERAELACRIAKLRGEEYVVHEWSPDDQLDAIERRFRCKCGTEFRCTLTGENLNRQFLHCPVCQVETTAVTTEGVVLLPA